MGSPLPRRSRKVLAGRGAAKAPAVIASLSTLDVSRYAAGWLVDGGARRHSGQTGKLRRQILDNLLWFLGQQGMETCGRPEITAFLVYLRDGHDDPGGRWGNPQMTRAVRPATSATYYAHLRTFFRWAVLEGALTASPMETMRPPRSNADQIQPFTPAQVEALLTACRRSWEPARDAALVWLLLDTGLRASELCGITLGDLDMTERRVRVTGKGDKSRMVYFGRRCTKALWEYVRGASLAFGEAAAPGERLFCASRGSNALECLTADGLGAAIGRLGTRAGLTGVRCSPHTFRHTFAVSFLRAGGSEFALSEILGHTKLDMTRRYVRFAQADIAGQRRYSPGDQMRDVPLRGRPAGAAAPRKPRADTEAVPKLEAVRKNEVTPKKEAARRSGGRPKLTEAQVRQIREALACHPAPTEKQKRVDLAARFGVSTSTVKQIGLGVAWKGVD